MAKKKPIDKKDWPLKKAPVVTKKKKRNPGAKPVPGPAKKKKMK